MGLEPSETDSDYLSVDQVREMIRAERLKFKTQADMARAIGVYPSFLANFLGGTRYPGSRVLDYLGLEETLVYRRKRPPT